MIDIRVLIDTDSGGRIGYYALGHVSAEEFVAAVQWGHDID